MDVVELYRNIPDDEGLSAVKKKNDWKATKICHNGHHYRFSRRSVKSDRFTFRGKTHKRKWWTAMGTKFPPLHSILFMAELEEVIIKKESEY